jgi:hypothetical protein
MLALFWGALAQAQEVKPLRYDVRLDLSLTLGAATLCGTAYLLQDKLVPARCPAGATTIVSTHARATGCAGASRTWPAS